MRILVKIMGFGGGAPLSLLQYVKYWKSKGHDIYVLGKYFGSEELYKKEGILTKNIKPFLKNRPILTYITIIKTIIIIEKYKPDILIWWTEDEALFGWMISDKLQIPSGYVFAGGKMLNYIGLILNKRPILVFSKENEKDLLLQGIGKEYLSQISNRISYNDCNLKYTKLNRVKSINAILMSRITNTLFPSIKTTIAIVEDIALSGIDIQLRIIGKGELKDKVEQIVCQANTRIGKNVIHFDGYFVDTKEIVKNATIAFGRGRSVIEPIMYGAIGIIVDSDGIFSICNNDTYDNISENNFSGRNIINPSKIEEIIKIIIAIQNNKFNEISSSYEMMRKRILNDYSIKKGYNKIDEYLLKVNNFNLYPSRYPIFMSYIKTYYLIIKNQLIKNVNTFLRGKEN